MTREYAIDSVGKDGDEICFVTGRIFSVTLCVTPGPRRCQWRAIRLR